MSFWREWRAERGLRNRAEQYALAAAADPAPADVQWLAARATGGDEDHARWELRYLRRALAQLVAERDALDDSTGSAVAQSLALLLRRDRSVAAERLRVAERQLSVRLARYREAFSERGGGSPAHRVGAVLLAVAQGYGPAATASPEPPATALAERYLQEAQERLRELFGVAQLPEDLPPSALAAETRRR